MRQLTLIFLLLGLIQCTQKTNISPEDETKPLSSDYFVFGRVGGFCASPCDRVFKIEGGKLFKDTTNCLLSPPPCNSEFEQLTQEQYELVKNLSQEFPLELFGQEDEDKKCKSCAHDGTDLFIEFVHKGQKKFWVINPFQASEEVKTFTDQVFEMIRELERE